MTTAKAATQKPTFDFKIPAAWGSDFTEFAGHDLTEKETLVGVPFLIIGAEIERNEKRGYDVAYVYALDVNGAEFEFSDTSTTGVRAQVQQLLVDAGLDPAPGAGYQAFTTRIVAPRGLRVSEFEAEDAKTGKTRNAQSYYLTGSRRNRA